MKIDPVRRIGRSLRLCMATIVASCSVLCVGTPAGCSLASPTFSGGPQSEIDARMASPDLLADKSRDETAVPTRQTVNLAQGASARLDTDTTVTKSNQRGVFNTSLAIIGGGSAAGISGLAGIALWLRWARKTGQTRSDAQTLRIKMLVELMREVIRSETGGG